jgi:hypothetical protein
LRTCTFCSVYLTRKHEIELLYSCSAPAAAMH